MAGNGVMMYMLGALSLFLQNRIIIFINQLRFKARNDKWLITFINLYLD